MSSIVENKNLAKPLPSTLKHFCLGNLAYLFFLLGTVFTVVGPVIHYSCYGLSLFFMFLSHFIEKTPIFKKPTGITKTIFIWFAVFFTLAAFPNAIHADSFYVWGKGASVFLEALLYTYMAFCLFDTDEKRKKLVTCFVWVNVFLAIEICLRPLYPMWFTKTSPLLSGLNFNAALGAVNTLGAYATLIFPVLLVYARYFSSSIWVELLLIFVAFLVTVCSFSVGYWGANVICLVFFLLLLILKRKLRFKILIFVSLIAVTLSYSLFITAPRERVKLLQMELQQASALFTGGAEIDGTSMAKFTNNRDGVWKLAIDMIREKPLLGWGYDDFVNKSKNFFENKKEHLHFEHYGFYNYKHSYYHPHNMYLAIAVAGGIPALLAFFIFALYLTFIAFRTYFKGQSRQAVIFALLTVVALVTQAGVGLTGDLFCARRDIGVIFWAFLGVFLATLQADGYNITSERQIGDQNWGKIAEEICKRNILEHQKSVSLIDVLNEKITNASIAVTESLKQGGKFLIAGNGGSAADAQHIAAEFTGRYLLERRGSPAEALTCNTSSLTSIANDYGYENVFARQLEAEGRAGDVLLAISTSGNSKNILHLVKKAKEMDIFTIGLTGSNGGAMEDQCDILINVPSDFTPRIQEMHILVGHIISNIAETLLNQDDL